MGGASASCHSEAPSSRFHWAAGFGRGAPRRRSRSSESSQGRSSSSRRLTWWAPRRATLPHPAALRGSGGRSSRGARSVAGPRSSSGRRRGAPVRGGPERAAPDLGAPDLGAADLGAPARDAPGRAGPDLGPSVRALAVRGRPVWPALFPAERDEAAPPPRPPAPVLLEPLPVPLALLVPPGLAGRRAPPLLPAPPDPLRRAAPPLALVLREDGRPVPPRLPCPPLPAPPPDRAGRADPPERADEARRFGWEEFWGIR